MDEWIHKWMDELTDGLTDGCYFFLSSDVISL